MNTPIGIMNSLHTFKYGFIDDMYKEVIETGVIDTVELHTTTLMYARGKQSSSIMAAS